MQALVIQRLFLEAFGDIFYFPVWWYTLGAVRAAKRCVYFFKIGNENLVPGLWLRNIFVPMFGQYDFAGRMISFFMRLIQVIFRGFGLLMWAGFCIALFALWLLLPIIISYGFISAFIHH